MQDQDAPRQKLTKCPALSLLAACMPSPGAHGPGQPLVQQATLLHNLESAQIILIMSFYSPTLIYRTVDVSKSRRRQFLRQGKCHDSLYTGLAC